MPDLKGRKPILCLDFDGVCHSYTSGWKGADVIPDPPVPGMFMFLIKAVPHFEIMVYSSRSGQPGGIEAMHAWFVERYMRWHNEETGPGDLISEKAATRNVDALVQFPTEKPPAMVGIDDRVLTFSGTWPAVEELRNFKPWNAKEV